MGMIACMPVLDLDYDEDSRAEADINVVMNEEGEFIEIQGTGESGTFSKGELDTMLDYAFRGIEKLITIQKQILRK